ncbi:MAG: hypothetical protein KGL52_14815 [Rhodospirillales bacterium]|nr:hypothetical protein [Rhodospirillales bacterium]
MRRPRLDLLRRTLPLAALLPVLAALGGCGGPGRDQFAPACPEARPMPVADHLRRYRTPNQPDGRDVPDLEYTGLVVGVAGSCRNGGKPDEVDATLKVRLQLDRGPAFPAGGVDVPYVVVVASGSRILSRHTFSNHVVIPPATPKVILTSDPIAIALPVKRAASAAGYTIWVGFNLTKDEFSAQSAGR